MSSTNPTEGTHTTPSDEGHGRGALWGLLILCGGVSWTLSLVHAIELAGKPADADWVNYLVGVLFGTAPVFVAGWLSHIIARGGSSTWEKVVTWAVLTGAMVISVFAQAATLTPYTTDWEPIRWIFPAVLDLSTIVALNKLMASGHVAIPAVATDRDLATGRGHTEPATSVAILTGGQIPVAKNVATGVANPAPVAMATTMASGQTVGQNGGHGQVANPADGHGHLAKTVAMATPMATPNGGQMANGHVATSAPVAKPVAKKVATAKPVATVPAPRPGAGGTSATEVLARMALGDNPAMSVEDLAVAIGRSERTARRLRPIILAEMATGHVATDKSTKLASGHVAKPMANEVATAKSVAKPANGQVAKSVAKPGNGQVATTVATAKTEDGHVAMATDLATTNDGQTAMAKTDDGHEDNDVATVTELATYSRGR